MIDVPTRLAAALLLKRGEISVSDIEALPLVENRIVAQAIASRLTEMFDVEMEERQGDSYLMEWEQVLVLRVPVVGRRTGTPTAQRQPINEILKAAEDPFTRADFEAALRRVSRRTRPSESNKETSGT